MVKSAHIAQRFEHFERLVIDLGGERVGGAGGQVRQAARLCERGTAQGSAVAPRHAIGDTDQASSVFEATMEQSSQSPQQTEALLVEFERLGWQEHVNALRSRMLTLTPDDATARYTFALSLLRSGDVEAATQNLQRALALAPARREEFLERFGEAMHSRSSL